MKNLQVNIPNSAENSVPVQLSSHRRLRSVSAAFDNPAFLEDPKIQVEEKKPVDHYRNTDFEKPYDPHDYGIVDEPVSFWGTIFHTIILMAGPGILSIPSLFAGVGYVVAAILLPCLCFLYIHAAFMFMGCEYQLCKSMRIPTLPYPEVAYHAFKGGPKFSQWFAKWSRRLSYIDFVIVWYSYYCYNYVIVCQNLQVLIRNFLHANVSLNTLLLIITIPMLALVLVPKLKYLVPVSIIGNICNALSLVLIVYFIIYDPSPWNIPAAVGQLRSLPLFIGTVIVNVNIAGILIPLKNEMKEPRRFASYLGVLTISYVPSSILYTLFSVLCVLKYGDNTELSVIENLPQSNAVAQIGIGLSSLAIICQQPLILVVTYDIIWNQILKEKLGTHNPIFWEYVLRVVLVLLAFVISLALPNIYLFLSLSGTVGTSIDSFFLPASMHTAVQWKFCENRYKFRLIFIKNMVIIMFAVILIIIGCFDCITQIIE